MVTGGKRDAVKSPSPIPAGLEFAIIQERDDTCSSTNRFWIPINYSAHSDGGWQLELAQAYMAHDGHIKMMVPGERRHVTANDAAVDFFEVDDVGLSMGSYVPRLKGSETRLSTVPDAPHPFVMASSGEDMGSW